MLCCFFLIKKSDLVFIVVFIFFFLFPKPKGKSFIKFLFILQHFCNQIVIFSQIPLAFNSFDIVFVLVGSRIYSYYNHQEFILLRADFFWILRVYNSISITLGKQCALTTIDLNYLYWLTLQNMRCSCFRPRHCLSFGFIYSVAKISRKFNF